MICEIIQRPGEKGSGGGRDAFTPGITYVCGKAMSVKLHNIASADWKNAAEEMILTSQLSARVQKPYYHFVLSWHEQEQPTDAQMLAAMDAMIAALGLDEHQIVIGTHHDTRRKHVHAIANTVHPLTGKTWSKSNDRQKAEAACRQIELDQGWSHDRGRFDFGVDEQEGRKIATLKPNAEAWQKKATDRKAGKRPKSAGDLKFEKSTGFETLSQSIPAPLKQKTAAAVAAVTNWQELHTAFGALGLTYSKFGSGARIGIIGSTEFAKASAFGAKFSIAKMEAALGPYQEPEAKYVNPRKADHVESASITCAPSPEHEKFTRAAAFKITLLRRTYTGLYLDPAVAEAIKFVDLADTPPQITFKSGATVVDHGRKLSTSHSTRETRTTMIAMIKAKGWSSVGLTGSPAFIRQMALDCAEAGIAVRGLLPDVQALADAALARARASQSQLERAAHVAQEAHLRDQATREVAVAANADARALTAALAADITAEAKAVQDAIGPSQAPLPSAFRKFAREDRNRKLGDLPDRRKAPSPQPAPNAAKRDKPGLRRIADQLRTNDQDEIERMKQLDISIIAELGGWADVSRSHPDSADKQSKTYRIFQRGDDTIKASLTKGKWLWTSNKTGAGGSVIDLWLHDDPGHSLGHARAALRGLTGSTSVRAPQPASGTQERPEERDHTDARRRWEQAPYIEGESRSYAEKRGISRETLSRFREEVRIGAYGGVYFAHRDLETGDIQGFEQRWEQDVIKNQARFAKGGRKSVNVLGSALTASRMIVVEGGLDALAFAELDNRDDTIYVSTGGGFGPGSLGALRKLAEGKIVISAFDNDAAGDQFDKKLREILPEVGRFAPLAQLKGSAVQFKDWLDVLNVQKESQAEQTSELEVDGADDYEPSETTKAGFERPGFS